MNRPGAHIRQCHGHNYVTIRLFCEPNSLCPRTHSFRRHDADMIVFCFAERDHAEQFRERFGGELVDTVTLPGRRALFLIAPLWRGSCYLAAWASRARIRLLIEPIAVQVPFDGR